MIKIKNIMVSTISCSVELDKILEEQLAGDIKAFLLKKNIVADVDVDTK